MKRLKKMIVLSVMMMTVLSMSVVVAPQASAASAGDLIKMDGLSSVYYLGGDGKRYVFPNEQTYFSWYSDFSSVVTIAQSELESYPLGKNVTIRPGTKLVKITTDPKVYAVTPGGNLLWIPSEEVATSLYGEAWASRVVDTPDSFFTNYNVAAGQASATAYPAGSLVQFGGADIYYIAADGKARLIVDEAAFEANRFSFDNVLTSTLDVPTAGADITVREDALADTSQGAGGQAGAGTGASVAVAATTAPSSNLALGQSLANLASFNVTASNDGAVVVKGVKLKKIGFAADATLTNVYLYEGNMKLTDAATLSSNYVTFSNGSGIITVPAGTTKTFTVKSDISTLAGYAGQTVGLSINAGSDITTNGAVISGSFPANGNIHSLVNISDLATVTLGAVVSPATTINAGTNDSAVWTSSLNTDKNLTTLSYVKFTQTGSIQVDALRNFKLYLNSEQIGETASLVNNEVVFDMTASPVSVLSGTRSLELRADIFDGSSRTFQFSVQTAADIVATDGNYGISPVVQGTFPAKTTATTINAGQMSVSTDSTFSETQVVKGASNVVLAKYSMKATGESVKVSSLQAVTTTTGTSTATEGLQNVKLLLNGSQVGSSVSQLGAGVNKVATSTFGTTNLFTVQQGETVTLEIVADLTQDSTSEITAVSANLVIPAGTFSGLASFATTPASDTVNSSGITLSVISGDLTVAKNTSMGNTTVNDNVTAQKIGSFIIQAGNAEAVRISNVAISLADATNVTLTDLSNIYISENMSAITPQAVNNFSVNTTLAANASKVIDVYASIGSIASKPKYIQAGIKVTATGVTTANSVGNASYELGQTITVNTGTLATPTLVNNNPTSMLVQAGSMEAANYKFSVSTGDATITELKFNVTQAATGTPQTVAVSSVSVGGVSTPVVNGVATFVGLNIPVTSGLSGVTVPVTVTYNNVTSANQGGAPTRSVVRLNLVSYKHKVGNTNMATVNTNVASNVMILVASIPTVTLAPDNTTGVSTGYAPGANSEVMRFKVANGGSNPINLKAVGLTPVYTTTLTSTSTQLFKIYDKDDSSTVLGSVAIGNSGTQTSVVFTDDFVIPAGGEKVFIVKADTTGLGAGGSFRVDLTATGDTGVSTGTNWQWNDSTVLTYGNGYLVKNLDLNGNSFIRSN